MTTLDNYHRIILLGGGITTRAQLKAWIKADFESYEMEHPLAARFTYGENWKLFAYMKNLRYMEWHLNNMRNGNSLKKYFHRLAYALRWLRWRKLSQKYDVTIFPHNVGPGCHLVHYGSAISSLVQILAAIVLFSLWFLSERKAPTSLIGR